MRIAVTVFALLFAGSVHADNLVVGVENIDYYPFYRWDGNNYTGFGRELLEAFAEKYHHTLTFKAMDIPSLLTNTLSGDVDVKFPDNAEWNKDKRKGKPMTYSKPVINVHEGLMVPAANAGKGIDSIKRIGTVRGFSPFIYLDMISSKKIALTEANSFSALVKIGTMNEVDGIYISPTIGNYQLTNTFHNPGLLKFDKSLPNAVSGFSLSSVKRPEIIKQFDEFLVQDKAVIDKLRAKFSIVE